MIDTRRNSVAPGAAGPARHDERGTALVLALSLLTIFGILVTYFVGYMNLELRETNLGVRQARADHLAVAGVQVALEGLRQEVLYPDRGNIRGEARSFEFTTYNGIAVDDGGTSAAVLGAPETPDGRLQPRLAMAEVIIFDESSRVNVNHAPAGVLQRILKVDASTARAVASSVPAGATAPGGQWLLGLDELISPSRLTPAQFAALDPAQLTVFSVADHGQPVGHFNVNEAAPEVLAAMIDVTEEQATQIKGQGPFASLEAFGGAVTAVTGLPFTGGEAAPALGLKSRCFRIISEGRYATVYDEAAYAGADASQKRQYLRNSASRRVEAVVQFNDDGAYEVLHWNADRELAGAGPT